MENSPVHRWFEDRAKAESNGMLLHAAFLLVMFPIACVLLLGVLMCAGYLFALLAPTIFYGAVAANFLMYPVVRLKFKPKEMKSPLGLGLTAVFIAPHLLWESISEFWHGYRVRKMSISPYLNLLQAVWGSEKKVSIDALSPDEDEAHQLALTLSKFPGVYYLNEERTISLSDKVMGQMSVIELSE